MINSLEEGLKEALRLSQDVARQYAEAESHPPDSDEQLLMFEAASQGFENWYAEWKAHDGAADNSARNWLGATMLRWADSSFRAGVTHWGRGYDLLITERLKNGSRQRIAESLEDAMEKALQSWTRALGCFFTTNNVAVTAEANGIRISEEYRLNIEGLTNGLPGDAARGIPSDVFKGIVGDAAELAQKAGKAEIGEAYSRITTVLDSLLELKQQVIAHLSVGNLGLNQALQMLGSSAMAAQALQLAGEAQRQYVAAKILSLEVPEIVAGVRAILNGQYGTGDLADKLEAKLGMKELISTANRHMAVSHIAQARANYNAGTANSLEAAAEKYGEAHNAFTEFRESFKTAGEVRAMQQWLGQLFPFWADAHFRLAVDSQNQGNAQIGKAMARGLDNLDRDGILQGLKVWDSALAHYRATVEVANKASQAHVQIDAGFMTAAQQKISEICAAANGFTNMVGKPEVAGRYLQIQQNAQS